EVQRRLQFLQQVGLGYVTLDRRAHTLSGGESQRIRLAAQVGAGLRGILYVLDEPSIGLHARDQDRLLQTLQALRDRGNTVVVVGTGVSGSGKSTRVHHVLKPGLQRMLLKDHSAPLRCTALKGLGRIDKLVEIDQAPIGRTPRSNAATYTGVWDHVRDLFAML